MNSLTAAQDFDISWFTKLHTVIFWASKADSSSAETGRREPFEEENIGTVYTHIYIHVIIYIWVFIDIDLEMDTELDTGIEPLSLASNSACL